MTTLTVSMVGAFKTDLERLMPGCRIVISHRRFRGAMALAATAVHKVTGRRLTVTLVGDDWMVLCAGATTSGRSAYGFDSAITHEYRHTLDYTSEHGPGTAWDYSQAQEATR